MSSRTYRSLFLNQTRIIFYRRALAVKPLQPTRNSQFIAAVFDHCVLRAQRDVDLKPNQLGQINRSPGNLRLSYQRSLLCILQLLSPRKEALEVLRL